MNLAVHRLDDARRADFYRVHGAECGADWCRCVAWWVPTWEGWGERTAQENLALREELFDRGEHDGYLLYADGEPVGWCQVGPRDRLAKLVGQMALEPDPEVWAVTCFVVAPRLRRRGLAARLLDGVLADLRARGVRCVEAYPKRGADLDAGELWTGPEGLYARKGFREVRDAAPRPVLRLDL